MNNTTKARATLKVWKENPAQFAYDQFKFEPDKWQKEVLDVFPSQDPDKMRISLQACAGPGKTAVLAICGWNFLSCYGSPGDHPKGAAVSITADNLSDNLWPEFAKWQSRSPFLLNAFQWTKTRIFANHHPETWFLSARSWSKTADAEEQGRTLSGLHSKDVLVLVDESGDVPESVLKAGEQALSNCRWGKIIQAGNPTSTTGILYAAATKLRAQWYIIRITGDPDDPNRSPRIDIEWARDQIKQYGRDNPWVMSYILGQFPPDALNTLIGLQDVENALGKHLSEDKYMYSQKRLGVDVARFGDDSTVIFPRQGLAAMKFVVMRGAKTNEIAARVAAAKAKWGSEQEMIDGTGGWGAGVIDSMIQAGYSPLEIQFAGKPIDPRYLNKRAEMWFAMANWLKRGGVIPNDAQLAKELTAPLYMFQNGKFQLESKEQIKKRLGFSPDRADALALTFALPEMPARVEYPFPVQAQERRSDWDPFDTSRL